MGSSSAFIISVFVSLLGMGYFLYGKKTQNGPVLLAGILLGVFPYFVSNMPMMLLVALVLLVLPWFLQD